MKLSKHVWRTGAVSAAVTAGFVLSLAILPSSPLLKSAKAADQVEEEYDRLDGMGASGKKVNVIEWEGNLEVHVYPAGSLKSLALTIDHKTKDKPVMVIGYRFNDNPQKQLIRRAIIDGLSLTDDFRTYRDTSAGEYDKIVITNNNLDKVLTAYQLEPKPTQLYPDGHPALVAQQNAKADDNRQPAALKTSVKSPSVQAQEDREELQDSGSIHPFMLEGARGGSARNR
jgi:hypothetical protein